MSGWRNSALAVLIATAASAAPARAATERFALLISNNRGGDDLPVLRYAGRDAQRMRDVLLEFGGFKADHVEALENKSAADTLRALREVEIRINQVVDRGDDALLLVYYSGHAKEGMLRLGESRIDMRLLKSLLEGSRARVRVALIDSCGAGAMTREKGGQLAPPFAIEVDDTLSSAGQVVIASSSADEASQESDEIQGSFFTHYLTTGLRGGADTDTDDRVTLAEAYNYAYSRTVAATAVTRSGTQHPTYEYDLRGAGDVVLTNFGTGGAVVAFPAELSGRYFLVDEERQLIVAELEKSKGAPASVALKGGSYVIKKRLSDHLLMQRMKVPSQTTFVVDEARMERISFENDYAKGTPILETEVDHGKIALSLSVAAGAQVVFESPTRTSDNLFPPIGFVAVEGRLHNLFRRNLLLSLDLGFGTRSADLSLAAAGAPSLQYHIQYSQLQAGTAVLYEFPIGPVTLAAGGRLATLAMLRSFDQSAPVDNQFFLTMSPGLVGLVGFSFARWFHVEAMVRAHYLLYNVDENRSFGYAEGLLSAWVDF